MSETYISNGLGTATPVQQLFIKNLGTAQEVEELYVRNPLSAGGYDIVYVTSDQSVNVTIFSLTQNACVDGEVICMATTGLGTLTYSFQILFDSDSQQWLPIQTGTSNEWGNVTTFSLPNQLIGYEYRCKHLAQVASPQTGIRIKSVLATWTRCPRTTPTLTSTPSTRT